MHCYCEETRISGSTKLAAPSCVGIAITVQSIRFRLILYLDSYKRTGHCERSEAIFQGWAVLTIRKGVP